jgi:hypothetical protein
VAVIVPAFVPECELRVSQVTLLLTLQVSVPPPAFEMAMV